MRTSPPDVGEAPASPQPDGRISPDQRRDTDQSNATRYLCVGAQVDSAFATRVIQEVLEQRYRAIAPSFGLDVVPVVVHALNGRSRRKRRDAMLVLIALGNLIVSPVLTVVTALSWLWMRFVYRIARQQWPSWHPRYALYIATVASVMFVPILAVTAVLLSVLVRILKPYIQSMPVLVT
jgi:hypothetical protein